MTRIDGLVCLLLCAVLSGCAGSTDSHYYSLMRSTNSLAASDAAQVAIDKQQRAGGNRQSDYALSIGSVTVPDQVDKAQIVLTDADSAQVTPLNRYLWASTLSDEIRAALGDDLSRQLGVIEMPAKSAPAGMKRWNVDLRVQRFESVYDQYVLLQATWRLTPVNLPGRKQIYCRAEASARVAAGMSALVEGHQQALRQMAALMSAAIRGGTSGATTLATPDGSTAPQGNARILGCT